MRFACFASVCRTVTIAIWALLHMFASLLAGILLARLPAQTLCLTCPCVVRAARPNHGTGPSRRRPPGHAGRLLGSPRPAARTDKRASPGTADLRRKRLRRTTAQTQAHQASKRFNGASPERAQHGGNTSRATPCGQRLADNSWRNTLLVMSMTIALLPKIL